MKCSLSIAPRPLSLSLFLCPYLLKIHEMFSGKHITNLTVHIHHAWRSLGRRKNIHIRFFHRSVRLFYTAIVEKNGGKHHITKDFPRLVESHSALTREVCLEIRLFSLYFPNYLRSRLIFGCDSSNDVEENKKLWWWWRYEQKTKTKEEEAEKTAHKHIHRFTHSLT